MLEGKFEPMRLRVLVVDGEYGKTARRDALARDNDDFRLLVDKALTTIYADPDPDTVQFFRTIEVPEQ
jgi:hypothetical protein